MSIHAYFFSLLLYHKPSKEEEAPTEKPPEQPKEPLVVTEPTEKPEPKAEIPVKKDLVLTKGAQQLAKAK